MQHDFPAPDHDHGHCVHVALATADACCARRGAKLTAVRRRVLELVWSGHEPVGAYALLDALRAEGVAAAPPTVYRALDFLLAHGLIHRIERLNAFVGCPHPESDHAGHFLICSGCGLVVELDEAAIGAAVAAEAAKRGFTVSRQTVEVEGLCQACRAAA